jgi:hypothetical protein
MYKHRHYKFIIIFIIKQKIVKSYLYDDDKLIMLLYVFDKVLIILIY